MSLRTAVVIIVGVVVETSLARASYYAGVHMHLSTRYSSTEIGFKVVHKSTRGRKSFQEKMAAISQY